PLIADVNGDGRANIVVGSNPYGTTTSRGLRVFGDPGWVETRSVWNQHAYHVTNVLEDGGIPDSFEASHRASTFDGWPVGGAGGSFRANASVPPHGFYDPAPDLVFDYPSVDTSRCKAADRVTVSVWVDNVGAAPAPAGILARLYMDGEVAAEANTSVSLAPGEGERLAFFISSPGSPREALLVVNEDNRVSECGGTTTNVMNVLDVGCPF
ncbi:MAG: CARDB domain-containing protein, partial [Myxococcota bacterium]